MTTRNHLSETVFAQSKTSLISKGFFLALMAVVVGMGLAHFFYSSPIGSAQTQEPSEEVEVAQTDFGPGEPITISWSVPDTADTTKDWVGIYHSTETRMDEFVDWGYTDESTTGSMDFSILGEGEYVARYFKNDTFTVVALSSVFTVSSSAGGGYVLTVPATEFGIGQPITITWSGPEGVNNAKDWIGLYQASEFRDDEFVDWGYTDETNAGTLDLTVFVEGTYVAKYFKNDSFSKVAETVTFDVVAGGGGGPGGTYTLVPNATTYGPGAPIELTWTSPAGTNNDKDWIGIYRSTETRMDEFFDWAYTGGAETGTLSLTVQAEGEFIARYFKNDTFNVAALTPTLTVESGAAGGYSVSLPDDEYGLGAPLPVTWAAPAGQGNAKDWIGVYVSTENRNDKFIDWSYTDGSDTGTQSLTVFSEGTYIVRYFTNDSLNKVAETAPFTVVAGGGGGGGGAYTLASNLADYGPGAPIEITWSGPTGTDNTKDWIGLYPSTETRMDEFVDWAYTGDSTGGTLSFSATNEGIYVARYFKNDTFTSVATTATFTVTAGGAGGYSLTLPADEFGLGEPLPITWAGPAGANNSKDWIGLYVSTEGRNDEFVDWAYTDETNAGTLNLSVFSEGTYVVRYFKNDSFTRVAQSGVFTITPGGGGGGYTIIVN